MGDIGYMFVIIITITVTFFIIYVSTHNDTNEVVSRKNPTSGKCDATSCSSIDPVSDPRYNMQQIVKQSILLEEHLANKNKRCRDCITKHFLHIIGLAEEAQMLATKHIEKYPLINDCVELYNNLFQKWLKNHDSAVDSICLNCCDELRTMRKKLIVVYFFNDTISN
jgi:hypothetical protein